MAITKAGLKKQLHAMGIKTYKDKAGASFVKKNDVSKILNDLDQRKVMAEFNQTELQDALLERSKVFELLNDVIKEDDTYVAIDILNLIDENIGYDNNNLSVWEENLSTNVAADGMNNYKNSGMGISEIVKKFDDVYYDIVKRMIETERGFPKKW